MPARRSRTFISRITRFRALPRHERYLLAEAALALLAARLVVAALPISVVLRWHGLRPAAAEWGGNVGDEASARRIGAVVCRAARHLPFPTLCLPRALAVSAMMHRRGIACVFFLGVSKAEGQLRAHAWATTAAGVPVIGERQARGYTPVAVYTV